MKRLILITALIYCLVLGFTSCREKNYINSGSVWATTYHISYDADRDLSDSIVAVMKQVENELSMFSPASTVSQINRGENPEIGRMFADVFKLSQRINILSGGAFDPTVGPLTNLWGFGTKNIVSEPTVAEIDSVLATIGIGVCQIRDGVIIKKHPATMFDFSSVAKGFGVDAVAEMLTRNGCRNYMVEIGGEVAVKGQNPSGKPWHIQIDAPVEDDISHQRLTIIELKDAAIATSGNYRNFRDTQSGRIGHTIDPHTGRPVSTSTLSATVIAPDCATADALATACMVMGADSALKMIENLPSTGALLAVSKNDSLIIRKTSNFPQ